MSEWRTIIVVESPRAFATSGVVAAFTSAGYRIEPWPELSPKGSSIHGENYEAWRTNAEAEVAQVIICDFGSMGVGQVESLH